MSKHNHFRELNKALLCKPLTTPLLAPSCSCFVAEFGFFYPARCLPTLPPQFPSSSFCIIRRPARVRGFWIWGSFVVGVGLANLK